MATRRNTDLTQHRRALFSGENAAIKAVFDISDKSFQIQKKSAPDAERSMPEEEEPCGCC